MSVCFICHSLRSLADGRTGVGGMLGDHSETSNYLWAGRATPLLMSSWQFWSKKIKGRSKTRSLGIFGHSWSSRFRPESDILERIEQRRAWKYQRPCSSTLHLINGDAKTHKVKSFWNHPKPGEKQGLHNSSWVRLPPYLDLSEVSPMIDFMVLIMSERGGERGGRALNRYIFSQYSRGDPGRWRSV